MMGPKPIPTAARFWQFVDKRGANECWPWRGRIFKTYGIIVLSRPEVTGKRSGRQAQAHRVAYELTVGSIPDGLVLDHLCRNRTCVNPAHLEPVTIGENVLRGETRSAENKAKTHCIHGHPFDEANTYRKTRRNGSVSRQCRRCGADRRAKKMRALLTKEDAA